MTQQNRGTPGTPPRAASFPTRWGEGKAGRDPDSSGSLLFKTDIFLFLMAAVQFSTGGLFLGLTWYSSQVEFRPWAGALLLAAAVVQGKMALKALKQRRVARGNIFRRTSFWRSAFVVVVLCYAGALALGPQPSTPYVFAAALSWGYTLLLLPIAVSPQILEDWKRISQRKIPRKTAVWFFGLLLSIVCTEFLMQGYRCLEGSCWMLTTYPNQRASIYSGLRWNENDLELGAAHSGLHLALLGNSRNQAEQAAMISRLETQLPGVRISDFCYPNAAPRDYANQLFARVAASRPDFVVAMISAGDDIITGSSGSDWFDWRSLAIAQYVPLPTRSTGKDADTVPGNEILGRQLSVCRIPMDADTGRRWKKTYKHLDRLAVRCERAGIALGLVIVPTEFQTNSVLRDTLCRRRGYEAKDIDCELPQRCLINFASERKILCIDLLPHYRRSELSTCEQNSRQWNCEGVQAAATALQSWLSTCNASQPMPNQVTASLRR